MSVSDVSFWKLFSDEKKKRHKQNIKNKNKNKKQSRIV